MPKSSVPTRSLSITRCARVVAVLTYDHRTLNKGFCCLLLVCCLSLLASLRHCSEGFFATETPRRRSPPPPRTQNPLHFTHCTDDDASSSFTTGACGRNSKQESIHRK